jgi:steroid 5-alpha reductase family enzyme
MKKIVMAILGIACVAAFILACSEKEDGTINVLWTLSWFAVSFVCGWLFGVVGDIKKRA